MQQSASSPSTASRSFVAVTPVRSLSAQFACVDAVFLRVVHEHSDQLERRVADHLAQCPLSGVARGPLDHPVPGPNQVFPS